MSQTVHENRLLFILTEDRGRIQVFDNRYKSAGKKQSAMDLYTYCEFVLYENQGKYTLNSAAVLDNFYGLRKNLAAAGLAGYFSQLCLFATQDYVVGQTEDLCSLLLNSLYLLSNRPKEIHKVKAVFEWKIILMLGFAPSLQNCSHLSFDERVLFFVEDGGLYCPTCVPTAGRAPAYGVTAAQIKAIVFILEQKMNRAFSFKLPEKAIIEVGDIAENYLQYHSGERFSALEIYKMLG